MMDSTRTIERTRAAMRGAAWAIALWCSACAWPTAGDGDREPVDVAAGALVNGTVIEANYSGVVLLEDATGELVCSGVLYTNRIVVTAKHCIVNGPGNHDFRNTPQNLSAVMGSVRRRVTALRVWQSDQPINLDQDIALLKLESGMLMRANTGSIVGQLSTEGFKRPDFTQSIEALNGKTLRCLGYGWHTHDGAVDGKLRSANLVATHVPEGAPETPGQRIRIDANSQQQILSHGDSGGPCLDGTTLDSPIATITSHGDFCTTSRAWNEAWPEVRDWFNANYPTL